MDSILKYLQETKAEIKEVVFPSGSQTINYTIIVISISVVIALILGGTDLGLREMLAKIISR